jgi:hypothetical protein
VETGTAGFEDAAHEFVADIDGVGVEEVESEDEDDRPAGERNQVADDAVPHLRFGARRCPGEHGPACDHEEHGHGPGIDRLGEVTEPPGIAAFFGTADEHAAGMADHDRQPGEDAHDVDVMPVGPLSPTGPGRRTGTRQFGNGASPLRARW